MKRELPIKFRKRGLLRERLIIYRREGGYLERDGVQVNIGKTIMTFNCYFFEKDIYVYDIGYLLTGIEMYFRNILNYRMLY